jgi:hypothetical protein
VATMVKLLFACIVENSELNKLKNALDIAKQDGIYNSDDFIEFKEMIENRIIELERK